jgi:hypothetical protein
MQPRNLLWEVRRGTRYLQISRYLSSLASQTAVVSTVVAMCPITKPLRQSIKHGKLYLALLFKSNCRVVRVNLKMFLKWSENCWSCVRSFSSVAARARTDVSILLQLNSDNVTANRTSGRCWNNNNSAGWPSVLSVLQRTPRVSVRADSRMCPHHEQRTVGGSQRATSSPECAPSCPKLDLGVSVYVAANWSCVDMPLPACVFTPWLKAASRVEYTDQFNHREGSLFCSSLCAFFNWPRRIP